jgi:4-hydroxy-tetrahydrodipicolinate synthase
MKNHQFRGTGVALVTPFSNGEIDFPALERVIEHVVEGGVDFLVSLGTTGEAVTLSSAEVRKVLDFTIQVNAGRLPIVAGMFGDNNTARLLHTLKHFNFEGIDAIMSSSPSYNRPTQEGVYQHYMAMQEASPLPIIIYNVPARTGSNVKPETILRLAHASEKFLAVKEAGGDPVQAMKLIKGKPEHFLVLSGDDPLTLPLLACGGDGAISVIANALPKAFSSLVRSALEDDYHTAARLNLELLDIHPWLYIDGNPAGVKGAMEILGICSREVRLPLVPMRQENLHGLQHAMGQ